VKKSNPKTIKGGVWQRLLDAMAKNAGKTVSNEELIKVSGQHNYARRVRELRAEGWDIVYSPSPMGYTLRSLKKQDKETDVYITLNFVKRCWNVINTPANYAAIRVERNMLTVRLFG
jgi:hypothetical protein